MDSVHLNALALYECMQIYTMGCKTSKSPPLPLFSEQIILSEWHILVFQVRIEDDIAVTEDGMECLTVVPRTVEEIEALMEEGRNGSQIPLPQDMEKVPL